MALLVIAVDRNRGGVGGGIPNFKWHFRWDHQQKRDWIIQQRLRLQFRGNTPSISLQKERK